MSKESKLFWIVTLVTLGWMLVMRPFTPTNIVQFELAKVVPSAQQIMDDWGTEGIAKARLSIYLDFAFILLYAWAIALGCKISTVFSGNNNLMKAGAFFSRIIWFAGSCDIIENVSMLFTLSGINELTVTMAFYFAVIKFLIVGVALLLILLSMGVGFFKYLIKD